MCRALQVYPSGYYKWLKSREKPEPDKKKSMREKVLEIHAVSRKTYGSPRILFALKNAGMHCNHKTVERIMKVNNIRAKQAKKFRPTTNSSHKLPIAKNILNRDFEQDAPNQAWVTDITYVWTDEGWLYLVVFIDLWSRRVVGWSMSDRMQSEFVRDAFLMACRKIKGKVTKLVIHSDRGSQYASDIFREALKKQGCTQSMSRKANCWDNAVAESFFGSIKKEMIHLERYETREAARKAIFDYIEIFYNKVRIHSTLDYLSPEQFELKAKAAH
jgi:putative transposase